MNAEESGELTPGVSASTRSGRFHFSPYMPLYHPTAVSGV